MRSLRLVPLPVLIVVASFLAPTELSVYAGGLRLPLHRLALIAFILPALWRIFIRPDIRIRAFDVLFLLFNVWTVEIYTHHGYGTEGLVYGGSLALESLGAYAVARAWVRDVQTLRATIRVLVGAVVAAGLIALPETLLGRHFVHDALQALTGYVHPRAIETRWTLTRAYGTFDHPIHLGTFAASVFALAWFAERDAMRRNVRLAAVVVATFAALSSAPLLCIGVQLGLITWERVTRGVQMRVALTFTALAGLYVGTVIAGTRSPIAIIATGFTIDSWTGYYRLLIWQYGLENVYANPVVGIGLAEWTRPWWMPAATVDAFWLLIAMRTGVPAVAMLLLAILLLARAAGSRAGRSRDVTLRNLARGWLIALVAISLAAATVHLWNAIYAYFFFLLGLGGVLANPPRLKKRKSVRAAVPQAPALPVLPLAPGLPATPAQMAARFV